MASQPDRPGRVRKVVLGTMIAVALGAGGLILNAIRSFQREQQVVVHIQALGGKAYRDLLGPDWLHDTINARFGPVRIVSLDGTNAADDDLVMLRMLPHLQDLSAKHTRITDAGLVDLTGNVELESLHLGSPGVTDAGVALLLKVENLRILDLAGTRVTDAGLAHLKEMRKLKLVFLTENAVSSESVDALQRARPELHIQLMDDN